MLQNKTVAEAIEKTNKSIVEVITEYNNRAVKSWVVEKSGIERTARVGINTVKQLFALRVALYKNGEKKSEKDFNEYVIRQVFNIVGDIAKSPFKSTIYNKLKAVKALVKLNLEAILAIDPVNIEIELDNLVLRVFDKFTSLNDLYRKVTPAPKKDKSAGAETSAETTPAPVASSKTSVECEKVAPVVIAQTDIECKLLNAAAAFMDAFKEYAGAKGYAAAVDESAEVVEMLRDVLNKVESMQKAA